MAKEPRIETISQREARQSRERVFWNGWFWGFTLGTLIQWAAIVFSPTLYALLFR